MCDTHGTHQLFFVNDIDSRIACLFQTVKSFRGIIDIEISLIRRNIALQKIEKKVFCLDVFSQNAQRFLSIERKRNIIDHLVVDGPADVGQTQNFMLHGNHYS